MIWSMRSTRRTTTSINTPSAVTASSLQSGKIATDTTPQFAAIDSSDNYVYVTNFKSKTVTEYQINTSSRLALIGRISNYVGQPFGVVANPSPGNVYVNDNAGLIYVLFGG